MKKRLISLLLCVFLLIGIFPGTVSALNGVVDKLPNGEAIFYTVINDVLQELKYDTMPIVRNGKYYIPYTLLTNNFNVRASYDSSEKKLYMTNIWNNIRFHINEGCAYDKTGKLDETAILYKGQIFVPMEFICQYFELSFAYISEGPILRIRDESSFYPDLFLSYLFESRMKEMRDELIASSEWVPKQDPPDKPDEVIPVTVYLTFDDGPSEHTVSILDTLSDYGYKATFFLIGSRLKTYESSVRKIYITGNGIGLHSFTHDRDNVFASPEAMVDEFIDTNALLRRILQAQTRIIRVPFGRTEAEYTQAFDTALNEAGYRFWDWTIRSDDLSEGATIESAYNSIVSQLAKRERETEVIRMHDCALTAEMLPKLLQYLKDNQYIVKVISPSEKPYQTAINWQQ